jgi:hypothetical protein
MGLILWDNQPMDFNDLPLSSRIRLGFDVFLASAREKHGVRFLYDRLSWKSTNALVKIYCARHGWFGQVANDHLKFSGGCYACAKEERPIRKIWRTWFTFLERTQSIHGERYQYDRASWRGAKSPLRIHCQVHGWFEQRPYDHLRLTGCTKCGHVKNGLNGRLKRDDVILRFRKVHGDRYSYEKMVYETASRKLEIVCREHGSFFQSLGEHLAGHGCQRCSRRHRWTTAELLKTQSAYMGTSLLTSGRTTWVR